MAIKPEKTEWNPTAGDRQTPTGSKKNTGFLADERPPYQFFNWSWWVDTLWQNFLAPAVRHNIIISDNTDEQDFATLAAYIADAPAVGDRVLITNDQVIAAQIIIPNDITLCIQDGVKFTSAIDLADSLIEFGSNVITEGILVLELSHTGVVNSGIELNGDGNNLDIVIDNTSTGTLAIGVLVNVAKIANLLGGEVKNTGAGAVTTVLSDLSLDESNIIEIRDSINNIVERSLGALSFLTGITWDLGSDADGDIYYRDAGILKRLPKGADSDILQLNAGLPSWQSSQITNAIRDTFRNLIIENNTGTPLSKVDIVADEVMLQNPAGIPLRAANVSETVDITVAGVNGRDQLAEEANAWYLIKLIGKADGTIDSILQQATVEGTTDGTTASKLIDSGASFQSNGRVQVGDRVVNLTDSTETTVSAIDSDSTLSLNNDIFITGENYVIILTNGVVFPSGYTFEALLGAVRNNSSSDFIAFEQIDKRAIFATTQSIKDGGFTTGAWTAQSVPSLFPPIAKKVRVSFGVNTGTAVGISGRPDGRGGSYFRASTGGGTIDFGGVLTTDRNNIATLECKYADLLYYFTDNANATLDVAEWEF